MTTKASILTGSQIVARESWLPMLVIALAQIQMGFNVSALPVSIGGIVEDFNASPSSVSTALVVYSLVVVGFVLSTLSLTMRKPYRWQPGPGCG